QGKCSWVLTDNRASSCRAPDTTRCWWNWPSEMSRVVYIGPTDVLPDNTGRWWLCVNGHEQLGAVHDRLKTRDGAPAQRLQEPLRSGTDEDCNQRPRRPDTPRTSSRAQPGRCCGQQGDCTL